MLVCYAGEYSLESTLKLGELHVLSAHLTLIYYVE